LTGYNSSIITLHLVSYSVLKGLCLSWDNFYILSKTEYLVNTFFEVFSLLRAGRLSRNSLFIISSLLKLVNSFFKVLEPLRVRDKSLKTTFISYHPFG
jgi:hypothetical protein